MFVLIWAALLLSMKGSIAYRGASFWGQTFCEFGFCITLREGEITAEAGLCTVIPCFFIPGYIFTPHRMVWYKCEPSKPRCGESDIIFHTNKDKVQSEFKGRVSLLEPDVNQGNCSIIINDLTESDSGSYQFRVNGFVRGRSDGFTFSRKTIVSVKDLMQKPTVMNDPLTGGQQATLTCTAPGLCSGSRPKITWTWSGTGEYGSHIRGNFTAFNTENLTAVTQRHSSSLTFNSSAIHHGTNITCQVSFTGDSTTEETVTLKVTYVKKVKITGNTNVKEGETLNLTCSVESFPPSLITWTNCSDKKMLNGTETNKTETCQHGQSETATFSISNVTAEHSGQYICTAKHLNNTLIQEVDVTVMYLNKLVITGDTAVEEGIALNLTCSVESFPLSQITWTILGSNTNLQMSTGSATLVIPAVTADNSGQYICTAKYLDTTMTEYANVTVILSPKILNNSGCEVQSEVLTCVCISVGIPLPTISWPLVKKHTAYSVTSTVSNHTVTSTLTVTVKDLSNTECVSSNTNGEAKQSLTIRKKMSKHPDPSSVVSKVVSWLEVIVAFLFGILLSAVIYYLAKKCSKRQKSTGNLDETLEMVTSQEDPLTDAGQAVEDDQTYYQEAAEEGEAVAAETAGLDLDDGPKDVEYASIDFSMLKRHPRKAAKKQDTTETVYAEIKKEVKEERKDYGSEEGKVLEGKEEEVMIEEDEETKHCVSEGEDEETQHCIAEEEEGEDMTVYSNVKEIMGEI